MRWTMVTQRGLRNTPHLPNSQSPVMPATVMIMVPTLNTHNLATILVMTHI